MPLLLSPTFTHHHLRGLTQVSKSCDERKQGLILSRVPSTHFFEEHEFNAHAVHTTTNETLAIILDTESTRRQHSTSPDMSSLTVAQFPCLDDNYGYLIHDETTGETAAIDTPSASAYKQELEKRGWKLTHILNTHQ